MLAPLAYLTPDATVQLDVHFEQHEMAAFRALSGDDNPIHYDSDFARERGFDGPIVYGGLILASISRLLGEQLPGPGCVWHSIKLDFRSPLYVGERAALVGHVVHFNPDLGILRLRVTVEATGRKIATGDVQALLSKPTAPTDG